MGLEMSQGSVLAQLEGMNNQLQMDIDRAERALHTVGELETTRADLEGKSYDSIREYFATIHISILQAFILYEEAIIKNNDTYKGYINTYLTGMGYVDEDGLKVDRENLKRQIVHVQGLMSRNKGCFSDYLGCMYDALDLIEEKLEQIENFVDACSNLYQNMDAYRSIVHQVISCIRNDHFDIVRNTYQISNLGTSWIKPIEKEWKNRVKNRYTQFLETEYGFDDETIRIMGNVYAKLNEKYPEASQLEIDWRFTRLMGGFVYDDKAIEALEWNDVAGCAVDQYGKIDENGNPTDMTEKGYITGFLGIPEEDYEMLRYQVRLQHTIVGDPDNLLMLDDYNRLEEERKSGLRQWEETCESSTNMVFENEEEFLVYWNERYERYAGKGDYAHQQITTATILANELNKDGGLSNIYLGENNQGVEEYAGWLGDAVLPPLTFGADDYKADLDAANIGAMIKSRGISYQEAMDTYYTQLENGTSRATVFLEHTELSYVKDKIYDEMSIYLELRLSVNQATSDEEIQGIKSLLADDEYLMNCVMEKSTNTYNFIRSLENQTSNMEIYE